MTKIYKKFLGFYVISLHTDKEFESTSKFQIGNRFHVTLRTVSPTTLFKYNLLLGIVEE